MEIGKKYTTRELAARFGCGVSTVWRRVNNLFGKTRRGSTRYFDQDQADVLSRLISAPAATGMPLAERVYQDWQGRRLSETDGYPCNIPPRPPLLRWNPYRARYGGEP
jgi:hypothetical protein